MKRRKIAGMRLGERLQLFTVEDSLLGRSFAHILKNLMVVVCVCLVIYVGYLVLQTLGVINITAGKDEIQAVAAMQGEVNNTLTNQTNNPKDILDILIGLVTVFVTAVTASQVYMMKDIDHMEMSHKIYKDNQEYRMNMEKAKKQLEALANDLSSDSNFDDIYVKDAYKDLRALAFHYEYIGYLVLRNRLNFDIAFDTITFPNWLIASREARKIMKYGREVTPDLWNGAEHLYLTYEVKRKYNKVKDIESLPEDSKKRKEEKARRKKALINARNEWKKHYRKLPK